MKSVKKNKEMRRAFGVAALVIVTLSLLGGTLARYTDQAEVEDSARVAKFNVTTLGKKEHLFKANGIYDNWTGNAPKFMENEENKLDVNGYKNVADDLIILMNGSNIATEYVPLETDVYPPDKTGDPSDGKVNIIAPGTSGYAAFNFDADSNLEVATKYDFEEITITNSGYDGTKKIPLEYSYAVVKNGNFPSNGSTWESNADTFKTAIEAIEGDLAKDDSVQVFIFWRWQFENKAGTEADDDKNVAANDAVDTDLGKQETGTPATTSTVTIKATTSLTQVD